MISSTLLSKTAVLAKNARMKQALNTLFLTKTSTCHMLTAQLVVSHALSKRHVTYASQLQSLMTALDNVYVPSTIWWNLLMQQVHSMMKTATSQSLSTTSTSLDIILMKTLMKLDAKISLISMSVTIANNGNQCSSRTAPASYTQKRKKIHVMKELTTQKSILRSRSRIFHQTW